MEVYSHDDPKAKEILEKIAKYTQQAEAMRLPYWVFVQDATPVGVVAIGREPIQLVASPGTSLALMRLIDTRRPEEEIENFVSLGLKLADEKNVENALATFSENDEVAIAGFKKAGFNEFDDCYRMMCQLDEDYEPSGEIQFSQVRKEEMRQFIATAHRCLQGSPDITLSRALKHMLELPDDFLDFYYSQERFYTATKNQEIVGVVDFNPEKGLISNVGVEPQQRSKGYGRQIMLFALQQLKNSKCKQAYLRVHVENKAAIHIYESLGFAKAERYKTLIWTKR